MNHLTITIDELHIDSTNAQRPDKLHRSRWYWIRQYNKLNQAPRV